MQENHKRLPITSEHSRKVRLGKMLVKMNGEQIGDYRIADAGKRKGVRVWQLEEC